MEYETDLLAELVQRRHTCLSKLRDLGRVQAALIASGQTGDLLRVLAAKQQLLDRWREVEQALDPFRQQQPEERVWRSATAREECATAVRRGDEALAELVRLERHCEEELRGKRDAVSRELHGAHHAGLARAAYLAEESPAAHTLDLTSGR